MNRRLPTRLVASLLIAAPFLFGALRLATTQGLDGRYLLVALASLAGVSGVLPRADGAVSVSRARAVAAVAAGTVASASVAVLLGGRSVVSIGLVSLAFASCIAGGLFLFWVAAARRGG